VKNKPTYSIDSVDHALRLAGLLQQEGPLRVADAAERLGVARSTAHRLLAMLVYRDFAVQMPIGATPPDPSCAIWPASNRLPSCAPSRSLTCSDSSTRRARRRT